MQNKTKAYILAAAVLSIGLFFFFKKKSKVISPTVQEEASAPQIQILDEQDIKESQAKGSDYMKIVNWDRTERQIDLKRTPLKIENGEAILDVEVVTKGTCFPGDANAIEMDLKAAPDHKLLATLESLSEGGISQSWDLPKDLLTKGSASKEFRVAVKEEPAQYGFFLCTANASDKSCRSKTVRDVNEIFTEHIRKDANAGKELRNIFFQYFLVDQRGLAAFSSPPRGNERFDNLKKYAKERQMKGNFEKEIDVAKKNIQTLLSFPFSFDGKKLKVELPQYNLAVCAQRKK